MGLTLATYLRQRSRADLEALLSARPDLLDGTPVSWRGLAERACEHVSLRAALDHLDLFRFQLLDALVLLGDGVSRKRFDGFVGARATRAQLDAGLDSLERLALAWRDGPVVRLNGGLRYVMPSPLAGLPAARRVAAMSGQQLQPVLRNLGLNHKGPVDDQRQRLLAFLADRKAVVARLDKAPAAVDELARLLLTRGAQISLYEQAADPRRAEALSWLRDRGMLLPAGLQIFELPRELRDIVIERVQLARLDPVPPDLTGRATDATEAFRVDGSAVHAMTEIVLAVERLTEAVDAEPPALLKSGGVGVRDLKRLAGKLGSSVWDASVLLELAAAAGLVRAEVPIPVSAPRLRQRQRARPASAPEPGRVLLTETCDQWRARDVAARWVALVAGWAEHPRPLASPDQPSGQRLLPLQGCQLDPAVDLSQLKRQALDLLDTPDACLSTDPAAAEQSLAAAMNWAAPLTTPFLPGLIGVLLREAESLGLVALGHLAEPARRLRSARSVADLLPAPVGRVTLQADLTALVAGPPARDLAALLDGMARRESRGGATTWRFTPDTVRAALDAGADGTGLLAELTSVATHGVPQPLSVLIGDVARRHGQLRVAAAGCVVRAEDAALAAEVAASRMLQSLQLRLVAPGVLVSPMPVPVTLEALRTAGYVPAHEDDKGLPVIERRARARAAARVRARGSRVGAAESELDGAGLAMLLSNGPTRPEAHPADLAPVIDRLLTVSADSGSGNARGAVVIPFPRSAAASLPDGLAAHMTAVERATLAEALASGQPVHLTYVDGQGRTSQRTVEQLDLDPPYLRGYCHLRQEDRTFALTRVLSVAPA